MKTLTRIGSHHSFTRRNILVALSSLGAGASVFKAFARSDARSVALVYDPKHVGEDIVARLLSHAGGEAALNRGGVSVARLGTPIGDSGALRETVVQLQTAPPSVVVVVGDDEAIAIARALPTLSMVFFCNTDPVNSGLVKSYLSPQTQATGVTSDWVGNVKPLEFLSELLPLGKRRVAIVADRVWHSRQRLNEWRNAAEQFSISLAHLVVDSYSELSEHSLWASIAAFNAVIAPMSLAQVTNGGEMVAHLRANRVMSMFENFSAVTMGANFGYEDTLADWMDTMGISLSLILDGFQPAEIPVRGPDGWRFGVNRLALEEQGIRLPHELIATVARVF